MDGEWVLVYANVEAFRSSPFFWGFQKMLPGGEELANSMFKFTAGLPVAGTRGPFGVISQTMSLETEELASEVEMKIFDPFFGLASGVGGTVVSTANVKVKGGEDGPGDVLLVTPRTTRVRNSNVGGALLDQARRAHVGTHVAGVRGRGGGGGGDRDVRGRFPPNHARRRKDGSDLRVHPQERDGRVKDGREGAGERRERRAKGQARRKTPTAASTLRAGLIRRFVSARGGEHDAERGVTTPITLARRGEEYDTNIDISR